MGRARELSSVVGIGAYSRRAGEYPPKVECAPLVTIEIGAIQKMIEKYLTPDFLAGYKVKQNEGRFEYEIEKLCATIAKDAPQ